ncbi:hypothetical protein SAY87_011509 [Trapa incisa]|uniref:Pentatricopeptide repeat-containing protein n=1 Tax=Trapa incisa TaxID=236973 RepID=A0AAN7GZH2_9MYRT|nr:hypothetical protein SAY87_011509 [Trapa incisa]
MLSSKPFSGNFSSIVNQILAAIIQNRPLGDVLVESRHRWTTESVSEVLRSIPRHFFQSSRSVGRQRTFRHRAPLKQRNLRQEFEKISKNVLVLGPAAHRDQRNLSLGLDKALEFFHYAESHLGFSHNEVTCREMSIVIARANRIRDLWDFLKQMAMRGKGMVPLSTITCLIKVLGEEGLANEAMVAFYRMKQFHLKPDVVAYNTMIHALCRVGNFKKARFLLEKMELPGFHCPPDVYTYTILIASYCKYGMQTGCRKAIRRRIWEANHLFRIMLFKGFVPDVVTYNCLIDGCCKTNRIERAQELFDDMSKRGCVPNRITYNSFIRYYSAVNEIDKAVEMLRRMQRMGHGVSSSSCYTPIIHALCEDGRVIEARDFLVELFEGGSVPREYTYKLVCGALDSIGELSLLGDNICDSIEDGLRSRLERARKVKPIMIH